MKHWHKCRRWWKRGIECPFSSMAFHEDDQPDDDVDDDGIEVPPVAVPAKRKPPPKGLPPVQTMAEVIKEIEARPVQPPPKVNTPVFSRKAYSLDPFGGAPTPPPRSPVKQAARSRVPVRTKVPVRSRVPVRHGAGGYAPSPAPVVGPVPYVRPRGATVPPRVAVRAMRIGFSDYSRPHDSAEVRGAVTEEATARAFGRVVPRGNPADRGVPRWVAPVIAAGAGLTAAALAGRGGRGGGFGGFFFNQAAEMKRLIGASVSRRVGQNYAGRQMKGGL